ncbi:MAG: hypothetical protein OXH11_05615, partial [Candidatus Aminicenantes bacterium]|nr:hypothetical protein [Candidatus Aminicenantes bacterium]
DRYPNALEATAEGLWVGEQLTNKAYLLDWKTGKVLQEVPTESTNTSGMAYGGGFLWMAANGPALRRAPRPTDATTGRILQVDPATGKTLARHPVPGGGGVHGLTWAENTLWITTLRRKSLTQVDPDFRVLHSIPVTLGRAHGLAWDDGSIWCMFSNDYVIHRLDAKDGRIMEAIQLSRSDPDPHGMTMHQGVFYYTDAGIAPGAVDSNSRYSGYICRLHL